LILRNAILFTLIKHRIENNISLPPTRIEAWLHYYREACNIIATLVNEQAGQPDFS